MVSGRNGTLTEGRRAVAHLTGVSARISSGHRAFLLRARKLMMATETALHCLPSDKIRYGKGGVEGPQDGYDCNERT